MAWMTRTGYSGAVVVADGAGAYALFPFGVELPNGTLRIWCRQGQGVIYRDSANAGATWGGGSYYEIWGSLPANQGGGFTMIRRGPSGRLHASVTKYTFGGTWETTYPNGAGWYLEYDGYYSYSDDGTTWSIPVLVSTGGATWNSFVPMDVLELTDGTLLMAGEHFTYTGESTGDGTGSQLWRSTDDGATWSQLATIVATSGSYFPSECLIQQAANGDIVATYAWYSSNPPRRHVRISDDDGATWSAANDIGTSVNHGGLLAHPDGDLILCYSTNGVDATKWLVSRDDGATWTDMGSVTAGTAQPPATDTSGYVANKWINPFVIDVAGVTPNLGITWGSSSVDDLHGSSFFRSFTRGADTVLPSVTGSDVEEITATTATVTANVDPNGASTDYRVEYGLTIAYGSVTSWASAGSGSSPVAVGVPLTGLTPSTTYHAHVVAQGSGGTTNGADVQFATGAVAASLTVDPGNGAWEQIDTDLIVRVVSGERTSTQATVMSAEGGYLRYFGADADLFELSDDEETWASVLQVPAGISTVYLSVNPPTPDVTLTAQVGVPV